VDRASEEFADLIHAIATAALISNGWHQHARAWRQWNAARNPH
jgi:hypothetical protein